MNADESAEAILRKELKEGVEVGEIVLVVDTPVIATRRFSQYRRIALRKRWKEHGRSSVLKGLPGDSDANCRQGMRSEKS